MSYMLITENVEVDGSRLRTAAVARVQKTRCEAMS